MSPAKGYIPPPRSVKVEESVESKMRQDGAYGRSPKENRSQLGHPSSSWTQPAQPHRIHHMDYTSDNQCDKDIAPSVKSFSSGPDSRRDSAISNSSKERRRRPKTARQTPKSSLVFGRDVPFAHFESISTRHRPRHYAMSPTAQSPTTNIEEALALHERSRQILAMAKVRTPYQSAASVAPQTLYPCHTTMSHGSQYHQFPRSYPASIESRSVAEPMYVPVPSTTTYWTSTETRRQEYAEIDKANKGFRGMFRKMIPKFAKTGSDTSFFDAKDESDVRSVRRYRLDLDEER